jgi:hypothetical protein
MMMRMKGEEELMPSSQRVTFRAKKETWIGYLYILRQGWILDN